MLRNRTILFVDNTNKSSYKKVIRQIEPQSGCMAVTGRTIAEIEAVKSDIERQKIIEAYGITFLCFTNIDIYENLENVLARIDIEMRKDTSPNPSL